MKRKIIMWIAWHLPKILVYWCYLRVAAHATSGKWESTGVASLSMMDALERWGQPNNSSEPTEQSPVAKQGSNEDSNEISPHFD